MRPRALIRTVALAAAVTALAGCQGKAAGGSGDPSAAASASASGFAFASATAGPGGTSPAAHASRGDLTIASAGFTESEVMAALYAALLTHAGYAVKVTSIPVIGTLESSLETGQADIVPQYAASYADQLNAMIRGSGTVGSPDITATMAQLSPLATARGVTALQPTNAVDERAFAVTAKLAKVNELTTLSDLGRLGISIRLAADAGCATLPTCQPGLLSTYGIKVGTLDPLGVDTLAGIHAVLNRKDQVTVVLTTDAAVTDNKLVILTDDKHLQPADNVVPIVNSKSLAQHPDIAGVLNALVPVLTTADLAQLNKMVDVGLLKPADVATAYLKIKKLI